MLVAATIMFEMIEDFFPSTSLQHVPLICKFTHISDCYVLPMYFLQFTVLCFCQPPLCILVASGHLVLR